MNRVSHPQIPGAKKKLNTVLMIHFSGGSIAQTGMIKLLRIAIL
jgi:hypothetical protein